MKTIEQIALETAQDMGLIANSVYEAFAKQFLAAYLEQQEPVAWVCINTDGECEQIDFGSECPLPGDEAFKPLFLAPPPAVQEGYVIVPKEPSEEMCAEGCLKVGALYGHHGARSMYQAMISAAPKGEQK